METNPGYKKRGLTRIGMVVTTYLLAAWRRVFVDHSEALVSTQHIQRDQRSKVRPWVGDGG